VWTKKNELVVSGGIFFCVGFIRDTQSSVHTITYIILSVPQVKQRSSSGCCMKEKIGHVSKVKSRIDSLSSRNKRQIVGYALEQYSFLVKAALEISI
jgi:hypothetical protein